MATSRFDPALRHNYKNSLLTDLPVSSYTITTTISSQSHLSPYSIFLTNTFCHATLSTVAGDLEGHRTGRGGDGRMRHFIQRG